MTTWLFLLTTLFQFSTENNTFEQYLLKGKYTKHGVKFQFAYKNLDDLDVLVVERYDTIQKVFVKYKDFTIQDIMLFKQDTFEFTVPGTLGKYKMADMFQLKLVSKSHFIKIYNDANAEGIFLTNTEKRLFSLNKKNNGLMELSHAQKQALKNELKVKDKGYAIVEETVYYEIEYNHDVEKYFAIVYDKNKEDEIGWLCFEEERELVIASMKAGIPKTEHLEQPIEETTWVELDDSYLTLFSQWSN